MSFTTPSQLLLLRGALSNGQEAVAAAEEWLRLYGCGAGPAFRSLEAGSRRLLPLLYQNIKESVCKDYRAPLREVYLEYWAKNQKLLNGLEKLLGWFQANAIPTLVLKGIPLSILHYRNSATRPVSDFDILVPEEQVSHVIGRLSAEGWKSDFIAGNVPEGSYFYQHIHAIPFTHPDYGELDLHWHVLQVATFRGADHLFWKDSVVLPVKTVETRALNGTDQLLHACVHGFAANIVAPIRWVADAVTVIRTSSVDWKRLLYLARELRVTIPLSLTLAFLKESFHVAIPGQTIEELRSFPVGSSDERYFGQLKKLERPWPEVFAYNWERHRRARRDLHPIQRLACLPHDLGTFTFHRLRNWISKSDLTPGLRASDRT